MKSFLARAAVLLVALALAGAGCKQLSPEQKVENMKKAMVEESSVSFNVSFSGNPRILGDDANSTLKSVSPGVDDVTVSFSGGLSFDQEETVNQQGEFSFSESAEGGSAIAGEYRKVDNKMYVKLSKADLGGELDKAFSSIDLTNQWLLMDQGLDFIPTEEEKEIDKLSADEIKALMKAFSDFSLVIEAEEVGIEVISGVEATKFNVKFDSAGIQLFAEEAARIQGENFTGADQEELMEMVADLNSGNPQMWIGNNDNLLYRIALNPVIDGKETKITITFSDYGKEVQVEAPADAVSFEEYIMNNLGGGIFSGFSGMLGNNADSTDDRKEGGIFFGDPSSFLESLKSGDGVNMEDLQSALDALGQ